jgi:hypothetical protein
MQLSKLHPKRLTEPREFALRGLELMIMHSKYGIFWTISEEERSMIPLKYSCWLKL